MSHQKGDVFGTLPKVRVGSHDVKLRVDQVQKETESLAGGGGPMMGQPGGGARWRRPCRPGIRVAAASLFRRLPLWW